MNMTMSLYDLIDLNLNSHFGTQFEYSVTSYIYTLSHTSYIYTVMWAENRWLLEFFYSTAVRFKALIWLVGLGFIRAGLGVNLGCC